MKEPELKGNTKAMVDLYEAYVEALHYIDMDTDYFSVSVGDVEIIYRKDK